jgi:hypothetical protein
LPDYIRSMQMGSYERTTAIQPTFSEETGTLRDVNDPPC